jgi:hypothetical protein
MKFQYYKKTKDIVDKTIELCNYMSFATKWVKWHEFNNSIVTSPKCLKEKYIIIKASWKTQNVFLRCKKGLIAYHKINGITIINKYIDIWQLCLNEKVNKRFHKPKKSKHIHVHKTHTNIHTQWKIIQTNKGKI